MELSSNPIVAEAESKKFGYIQIFHYRNDEYYVSVNGRVTTQPDMTLVEVVRWMANILQDT